MENSERMSEDAADSRRKVRSWAMTRYCHSYDATSDGRLHDERVKKKEQLAQRRIMRRELEGNERRERAGTGSAEVPKRLWKRAW